MCVLRKKGNKKSATLTKQIQEVLADGEWHTMKELLAIRGNEEDVRKLVQQMIEEEEVVVKGAKIKRK